jgi:hypothetical protein
MIKNTSLWMPRAGEQEWPDANETDGGLVKIVLDAQSGLQLRESIAFTPSMQSSNYSLNRTATAAGHGRSQRSTIFLLVIELLFPPFPSFFHSSKTWTAMKMRALDIAYP